MLSDDVFEDELRLEFSMMDSPVPTAEFVEDAVRRYRRCRRRRRLLVVTPGIAAASGLGLALGLSGVGSPGPLNSGGPARAIAHAGSKVDSVQLANYVFHLPASFHLTDAVTTACRSYAVPATTAPTMTGPPKAVRVYPYSTTQIAAAANSSGGCVYLALTASFTPTTATPNPGLPFTGTAPGVRQVDVGGDTGWLRASPSPSTTRLGYLLTVELPLGNGQMRDLAVASIGLNTHELLTIVSKGLS